jgi:GPH family glycoside/pentoside/hexuronide:cation symporter
VRVAPGRIVSLSQTAGEAPERLGLWRAIGFSGATLPVTAMDTALLIYLPPHLSGRLGIPLGVVGVCWALVRMLDIIVDPLLGVAMDATRTRFGRYRLWMLLGVPVAMLSTWVLFFAKPGIGPVFLVTWLLVLYLARSILHMAHPAWAATLATTYNARSRLFGVMSAVMVAVIVLVLLIPELNHRLLGDKAVNIELMGWFIIVFGPLSVGWAVWRTGERLNQSLASDRPRLGDYLKLLTKPDLVRLYGASTLLTLGPGAMSALYIFFYRDHQGFTEAAASRLLALYILAGLAGAPVVAQLATRIGKPRTLMVATTAYSLGLMTVLLAPRGSFLGNLPTLLWCGFAGVGFDLMVRSMLADVADQVRLEQGRERLSLVFALNTLTTKIATAAAVIITYPLLERIGYSPKAGAHNSVEAINGLGVIFVGGPILFVMLGGACLIGWKMTAERHAQVRAELDLKDAAAAAEAALGLAQS